eukprot:TCONS_00054846-protein
MDKMLRIVLFLVGCFGLGSCLPPNNASLEFVAKDWAPPWPYPFPRPPNLPSRKMVFKGVRFTVNCTTNDPDAVVQLFERVKNENSKNSEIEKGGRIQKVNQTFVIDPVESIDIRDYECIAEDARGQEKILKLGFLNVNRLSVLDPIELYPRENPTFIHEDEKKAINCSSEGHPGFQEKDLILSWYRLVNGKEVKITDGVIHRDYTDNNRGGTLDYADLVFTKFSKNDEGVYICKRILDKHVKAKNVTLKLITPYKPKVALPQLPSGKFSRPTGYRATVVCELISSPPPSVKKWMKGSTVIEDCSPYTASDCILSIGATQHSKDSGDYYCVGENKMGETKVKLDLQITEKVELDKPTTTIAVIYEEDRELVCNVAKANPPPTIVWEYQVDTCEKADDNCVPLDNEWKRVTEQTPESETPTMKSKIISKATQKNHFYRCVATNKVASIQLNQFETASDTYNFKVIRTERSKVQFVFLAESTAINENDKINISCIVDMTKYKKPRISKIGDNRLLTVTQTSGANNIDTFTYWKPISELTDSGSYICEAENQRGTNSNSQTLEINIEPLVKAEITDFEDMSVSQNDRKNLRIFCNATGNPAPVITWTKDGKLLDDLTVINGINQCRTLKKGIYIRKKKRSLVICNLNFKDHGGTYECCAKNALADVKESLELLVYAKPVIRDLPAERTFGVGDGDSIFCTSVANPPANVTWERVTNNSTVQIGFTAVEKVPLDFAKVSKDDAGPYRCTATNEFGTVSETVDVIVKGTTGGLLGSDQKSTIIGIVVAFALLLIIIIIFVCWYRRHLKAKYAKYLEPNETFILDPDRTLFDQSNDLPYDMSWEFPRERVTFIKTLGSGAFGQVWLAEAEGLHSFKPRENTPDARRRRKSIQKGRNRYHSMSFRYKKQTQNFEMSLEKMMVAVKTLKDGAAESEYKDLASELKILIHLGEHKNIVNLLGACTTGGKLCVILECCPHGSLLNFLRSKRDVFKPAWAKHEVDMEKECSYIDLAMTAWQVSKGMDFLQTKKLIHRDLAARNVLVGDDYIMKIADFGLARDIYADEFYLKNTTGLLPIKWMAPESIFDRVYTTSSDVWSYGILLWEIFTLGGSPYPGLPTENLRDYLESGRRMECPEQCPKDIYEIMLDCWAKSPYERPLFAQITERLNNCMKQNISTGDAPQNYLDFTDAQDNYLQPEKAANQPPPEYLQASAGDDNLKDDADRPLLAKGGNDYLEDDFANHPPPPPPPDNDYPEDRYVSSDQHYKVPKSNAERV